MYENILADIWITMPMMIVALTGVVVILWDCFQNDAPALPILSGLGLALALVWEATRFQTSGYAFDELILYGGFSTYMNVILLISALLCIGLSNEYLQRIRHNYGEVYGLILFATLGMMVMASSNNLIMIFVGLETMSICLYILTGLVRDNEGATESALKYFLLGAFSTGFFLYGIALLYGATGTMYLHEMQAGLAEQGGLDVLFWAGVGLLLVGFLFKVSAVPFHMWTPDVYQGAPTTLTGFMATGSKAAAFGSLILVLQHAVPAGGGWGLTLALVATVTMVVGNVLAISQQNVKRMLAYSSIAHAGYILVALASGTPEGYAGTLYYLLVYTLMNIGAFGVLAVLERDGVQGREQTLDTLAGMGLKRPLLGVLMVFFMFSLTGFPPFAGFFGKLFVFAPAIQAGMTWLVIIGVLASAVSAYYYLRVLFYFYMKTPPDSVGDWVPTFSMVTTVILVLCAFAQLALVGALPAGMMDLAYSFFDVTSVAALP